MLLSLDDSVGAILQTIEEAGVRENTIVWYFSDNGGLRMGSSLPFRGGKLTTREGGIHVPAAIRWPAGGFSGGEYQGLLGHLDVLPTLAGLLKAELKTARPLDGLDCSAALLKGADSPVQDGYWAWRNNEVLRTDRWKLFRFIDHMELYDMRTDQTESTNLAQRHPEVVEELAGRMKRWRKDLGVASPLEPPDRRPISAPSGDVLEVMIDQTGPVDVEKALGVQIGFRRHRVDIGDEFEFDIMMPKGDLLRNGAFVSPYRNGSPPVFKRGVGIDQRGRIQATGEGPEMKPGKWERRVIGIGHEAPLLRSYHGVFFQGGSPGRHKLYLDNLQIRRRDGTVLPVWRNREDTETARRQLPPQFRDLSIRTVSLNELE